MHDRQTVGIAGVAQPLMQCRFTHVEIAGHLCDSLATADGQAYRFVRKLLRICWPLIRNRLLLILLLAHQIFVSTTTRAAQIAESET